MPRKTNHPELVAALQKAGCSSDDLAQVVRDCKEEEASLLIADGLGAIVDYLLRYTSWQPAEIMQAATTKGKLTMAREPDSLSPDLTRAIDDALIGTLPATLTQAIDALRQQGVTPGSILLHMRRRAGGGPSLAVQAVEAYLLRK